MRRLFESHLVEGRDFERWLHELRRLEFELTLKHVPLSAAAKVLEVGSGDGFQLGMLRRRFEHVLAIDPRRAPAGRSGFVFAHAEALPFSDGCFDLVFSSNVFEHLQDRRQSVEEVVRILRPGGYIAHIMPSRIWKAASLLMNPACYALHLAGKWSLQRRRGSPPGEAPTGPPLPRATLGGLFNRCFRPPVHGTFSSHLAEFWAFGKSSWRESLSHPRLEVAAEVPLIAYSPFGLFRSHWLTPRIWLGRHGVSSVHGFVLRKIL
jgi:SAM-dependent methyltransferase